MMRQPVVKLLAPTGILMSTMLLRFLQFAQKYVQNKCIFFWNTETKHKWTSWLASNIQADQFIFLFFTDLCNMVTAIVVLSNLQYLHNMWEKIVRNLSVLITSRKYLTFLQTRRGKIGLSCWHSRVRWVSLEDELLQCSTTFYSTYSSSNLSWATLKRPLTRPFAVADCEACHLHASKPREAM